MGLMGSKTEMRQGSAFKADEQVNVRVVCVRNVWDHSKNKTRFSGGEGASAGEAEEAHCLGGGSGTLVEEEMGRPVLRNCSYSAGGRNMARRVGRRAA